VLYTNFLNDRRCWWHRVFLRQRTVVDADYLGGWTDFSAVQRLSRRLLDGSKKTQFLPTPHQNANPVGDDAIGISSKSFASENQRLLESPGYHELWSVVFLILCSAVLVQHRLVTDELTTGYSTYRASNASCGKNACKTEGNIGYQISKTTVLSFCSSVPKAQFCWGGDFAPISYQWLIPMDPKVPCSQFTYRDGICPPRSRWVTHPSSNRPIARRPEMQLTTIQLQVRRPNH